HVVVVQRGVVCLPPLEEITLQVAKLPLASAAQPRGELAGRLERRLRVEDDGLRPLDLLFEEAVRGFDDVFVAHRPCLRAMLFRPFVPSSAFSGALQYRWLHASSHARRSSLVLTLPASSNAPASEASAESRPAMPSSGKPCFGTPAFIARQ